MCAISILWVYSRVFNSICNMIYSCVQACVFGKNGSSLSEQSFDEVIDDMPAQKQSPDFIYST